MSKKIVIIGGGFSGLASAALLAQRGYQVTLLEKNAALGGRARVFKQHGFQFDMGPSWYMMPEIFEKFFAHFHQRPSDFYELVRLKPSYRVWFERYPTLDIPASLTALTKLFEKIEVGAGHQLTQYLNQVRHHYLLATESVLYLDPSQWRSWCSLRNLWSALRLVDWSSGWRSWATDISRRFKDIRLQQIIGFPAVFLGGSPYITPALFSLLSWADFGQGIWYPLGGMTKMVEAITRVAQSQGATLVCRADVTEIVVKSGEATGVKVGSDFYPADYVIAAADLPFVETQLLPAEYQTYPASYWQKKTIGISAVLVYLGLNQRLTQARHHSLYFADNWQAHFDTIAANTQLPDHPSFYTSIRSVTDRSIVPPGAEELFVLIPVGANTTITRKAYEQLADQTLNRLETLLGTRILDNVVVKKIYTPHDFAADYHAFQGTALGLAHTWSQSLFWRPSNRSKKVKNLYYTGQYTNPGVGVPMALVSAEIVTNLISTNDRTYDHTRHF